MYAIIEASGKQFRAEPESTLRLPRLKAEPGDTVTFDVLLAETNGQIQVGQPSLDGASVAAEVVRHGKGEKIVVFKRKRRKGYRKKQGHRQGFTEVRVTEITVGKAKPRPKKEEVPAAEEAVITEAAAEPDVVAAAEPEAEAPAAEIDITDAARTLAEENGLDLTKIEGSGAGGRILKGDVQKAIRAQADEE
jgi:large subunit ribosomal protein L21